MGKDEKKACIRGCGAKTTEPSLICGLCQIKDIGANKPASQTVSENCTVDNEGGIMFKDKKCECGVIFKPKGARSVMCEACKLAGKKAPTKKKAEKKIQTKPIEKEKTITPDVPNVDISLLSLNDYPEIKAWLLKFAKDEFRTPEMQIVAFLNDMMDLQNQGGA